MNVTVGRKIPEEHTRSSQHLLTQYTPPSFPLYTRRQGNSLGLEACPSVLTSSSGDRDRSAT